MDSFLHSKGILHQRTCVKTPHQNGVVKRKHQHILNMARSLAFQANLPINLWTFSTQHAIHIINRLPTPFLKFKIPYELFHKEPSSIIHSKVFGYLCYVSSLLAHRTKFDTRARKAMFLSFKDNTKGYILYNLNSHNIFVSRNVIFYDTHLPFKPFTSTSIPASDPPQPQPPLDLDIEHIIPLTDPPIDSPPKSPKSHPPPSTAINMTPTSPSPSPDHHNDINIMQPTSAFPSNSPPPSLPIRKSICVTKPPSYVKDFYCNDVLHNNHDAHIYNAYPLSSVFSYEHCTPSCHAFCCSVSTNIEPQT